MRLRALLFAALPASFLILSACGGGTSTVASGAKIATQTPQSGQTQAPASPTPTLDPAGLGPAPVLGGNITSISPEHGAKVSQAATRSPNPNNPGGLCVQVTFEGLPENAQWFRVAFDGEEVTPKLVWIVKSTTNPTDGRVCYSPVDGFTPGRHSAAISVQDPRNATAPTRQLVAWKFDVTP